MLFNGQAFRLETLPNDILKVVFDLKDQSTNVFNALALKELGEMLEVIKKQKARGLLFTSGKASGFVFGADVTEFLGHFKKTEDEMKTWIASINKIFNGYEDLPYPKVCLINGFALGGGCEITLTMDYRLASPKAAMGLPETKLGIIPGWGGTVRLPRLVGADHAIEWITGAKHYKAEEALKFGAIDGIIEDARLEEAGIKLIEKAIAGEMDWQARVNQKKSPLKLDKIESAMSFDGSKAFVAAMAGPNYPAPVKAVETMQKAARMNRDEALALEGETFAVCAKTKTAECLTQVFLGDQYLKKVSKSVTKNAKPTQMGAVLGAGIMGGGIAYQSASTGTPVLMKDIKHEQLDLGMNEAGKLLLKEVERKKMTPEKMAKVIAQITPTLSYADFGATQFVVEAVVENEKVKKSVLAEVEKSTSADTVLASNTSTISITKLAEGLARPDKFCGMHFFNPVHRMPLVEIIRGAKSSEETIAQAVNYAVQMGKTPIVVNDCAGFLVNRILFPYFKGFAHLIEDGVDFQRIDKVMEKFGWPMGPAYLLDVVGIDTGVHAAKIMADAFPDRMAYTSKTIMEVMYENKRFGQKNGVGFYEYEIDKKGKPVKKVNPAVYELIKTAVKKQIDITDEEIIMRMMIPMIVESSRCLEDKIVNTPVEVDMGLLLGLGFPPFRAGALKYADTIGLKKLEEESKKYQSIGHMYDFTPFMKGLAAENKTYY
ncbi:fatty acid oxidation complex subunit alpha FadB [Peredibacter starrii]|uniref:enoyl-CoA hydratase n=1 Tax=Peredibacter starrii TaxID=28202 RepID=A0AAX4HV35_9BACT|nr:fatty acid oxidation complex subunit alpha FadB [Peredibacter starrii]WPU67139.1 fatty acid oxidation complex subunit alpha FadB [Peredibacter starrii]